MKDFIVWDKIAKEFADNICLDAELLKDGISYSLEVKEELFELFYPIGLKDINGKTIYADSSIVEYGIQKWKVIYNVFQMSYELECVSNKSLSNMRLTGAYQNQLKIIDTIQENKLGLIK